MTVQYGQSPRACIGKITSKYSIQSLSFSECNEAVKQHMWTALFGIFNNVNVNMSAF